MFSSLTFSLSTFADTQSFDAQSFFILLFNTQLFDVKYVNRMLMIFKFFTHLKFLRNVNPVATIQIVLFRLAYNN
jgi:hypothetical protein